jgi:putative aldouronate transport system permease protein
MARRDNTVTGRVFDAVNILVLVGLGVATVLPFLYVAAGSLAKEHEISTRPFFVWPHEVFTGAYRYLFATDTFVRSLLITVGVTAVGTVVQLLLTFAMAYPLAKRFLPGRGLILSLVVFTMVFGGGLIPTYLIVKNVGLLDTYWALILPLAINPFYLIVVKNFFQELPEECRCPSPSSPRSRCSTPSPSGTTSCRRCST